MTISGWISPGRYRLRTHLCRGCPAFTRDFRQLFVKAQRLILSPRVFAPLSLKLGYLPARSGINHVFSGMLQSLAEVIEEVSPEQLRPVERHSQNS